MTQQSAKHPARVLENLLWALALCLAFDGFVYANTSGQRPGCEWREP
jgi:hypothetical protein